ncbi:TDT family transporter [Actinomadura sp. HBU206391]|uniref:TDT family transporter n=1 Tax=Actinomadura sp. HBU206391 TaxID=2731692 RepID=UPI001650C8C8|nr:TDT family transporter [Actinomadura sp. HBU206391]MBC6460731.1 TDT family transporter [Actinomadura sp. HBU206391]
MVTSIAPAAAAPLAAPERVEPFRHLGPNWYACVMGTAIVANGAGALPVSVPGQRGFAVGVWALSAVLLLVIMAARTVHLLRYRAEARAQLLDGPAMAVFYGCPPMALLAVGYGTLTLGRHVIGLEAAVTVDLVLWTVGTLYALVAGYGIPYLFVVRYQVRPGTADPTWLLPVVAPMVAAALGPALVPHLPAGAARESMLYGCYAMFGMSLLATLVLLPGIWTRLVHDKLAPIALTPTLFLVLGPLGQSTTAVNQLAGAAADAAPRYAGAMGAFAVLYGVPVMGFAMLWLAIAATANARALRRGMPFAMTWWGYTFPVGTCVTGAAALAGRTGLGALTVLAVGLYLLLVTAWVTAAAHTAYGALSGRLFRPALGPRPAGP